MVHAVWIMMCYCVTQFEHCFNAQQLEQIKHHCVSFVFVSKQIDPTEQKTLANLPWIVEPGQEAKRGINTKYETTIF